MISRGLLSLLACCLFCLPIGAGEKPLKIAVFEADVTQSTAVEVAHEFWRLMATNDFHSVAAVLAPDFVLERTVGSKTSAGARAMFRDGEDHGGAGALRPLRRDDPA